MANFHSIILSPIGKKAAFDLYGGMGDTSTNQWDIYVGNIDVSTVTQITNDPYQDGWPQFNPAGTTVIYSSLRPSTLYENYGQWMLVTKNADGTGTDTVLPFSATLLHAWSPTYSPDGSKIAVEGWGYDQQNNWVDGIYIMNADGSNPIMLTNPSTECDCYDDTPTFTSDGSKIVFSRNTYISNTDTEAEDIYAINADGTGTPTKLTDNIGYNSDPIVLRDLTSNTDKILFASNRDNLTAGNDGFELYAIGGTGLTRLTSNAMFDAFSTEFYTGIDAVQAARVARSRTARQTIWVHTPGKTLHW